MALCIFCAIVLVFLFFVVLAFWDGVAGVVGIAAGVVGIWFAVAFWDAAVGVAGVVGIWYAAVGVAGVGGIWFAVAFWFACCRFVSFSFTSRAQFHGPIHGFIYFHARVGIFHSALAAVLRAGSSTFVAFASSVIGTFYYFPI